LPGGQHGGTDSAVEGDWRWVTGEAFWLGNASGVPLLYTNWSPGQPDDFEDIQEYAVMLINPVFPAFQRPGQWDDIPLCCTESYVVEFEAPEAVPEPATGLLLAAGIVGLTRSRQRRRQG
jgi:hypothetical protein